ncbi:hypothetical protein AX16_001053 [Volvariella volvacea WC 439]|nr:hypothetical protein AX16_001053 [Volvariella volvacea WC 439]
MSTSELLGALDPHATHPRLHNISEYNHDHSIAVPHPQPSYQQPHIYVTHRSELEIAMVEQPQVSLPPPPPEAPISDDTTNFRGLPERVQELYRLMATIREEQENERSRRIKWEQEQEAKHLACRADLERRVVDLEQELSSLKAIISSGQTMDASRYTHATEYSVPIYRETLGQASPTASTLAPPHPAPSFVQGSSTPSYPNGSSFYDSPQSTYSSRNSQFLHHRNHQTHAAFLGMNPPPILTNTPTQSPQLDPLANASVAQDAVNRLHKRQSYPHSKLSSPSSNGDDSDISETSSTCRPVKRISHHDKRCFTVHHAMRKHILHLMQVHSNDKLPPSHVEGEPLAADDPVRFVWDKTTRQSVHNARMKTRILDDLKANRSMYPQVPKRDFNKKNLETTFEQSFTHFRQKFKAQVDDVTASRVKDREQLKARKSRHIARRKLKLSNRAEARLKIQAFEHVIFDGALQVDCMSSEESDPEYIPSASHSSGLLRTRGYLWRSTRLMRFYCILDSEEKASKSGKPKRGSGKMERCVGPPKDGFHLPPKGVAQWMISRRWLYSAQAAHPDLPSVLGGLVVDPPGFDWQRFELLGNESDAPAEGELEQTTRHHPLDSNSVGQALYSFESESQAPIHPYAAQPLAHTESHVVRAPYTTSSSSLSNALMMQ